MLTSIRGLTAASLSAGLLLSAAPAFATETASEESASDATISNDLLVADAAISESTEKQNEVVLSSSAARTIEPVEESVANSVGGESGITFSGNIAFTTEYRFRGVDLSGGDFAVQGGFDLGHSSGLYVGTWASNLDEDTVGFGSTELDIYGGWSGDLTDGLSGDVGVIYYIYPNAPTAAGPTDYIEFYASVSASIGPVSVTPGIAYAPDQDSLGSTDNVYLYTDVSVGIPETPLTINGHVGYTDGFLTFTNDSKAFDWSISADVAVGPATLSAAYVGVEGDALIDPGGVFTDDAFVLTLSASF
ncbi:TorF family putative porin [uncultured Erythrobacter sp.]|uniref:TorF family putative porin n=1 Tax=uncultured Erythrobacter sp. TaxID=263913 RepID=UPI0026123FC7|nr:TorF family putative porin [uncultured Erythrobacter sp.]